MDNKNRKSPVEKLTCILICIAVQVSWTQGRWVWLDGIGLGKGVGVLLHWGGGMHYQIVFTVKVIPYQAVLTNLFDTIAPSMIRLTLVHFFYFCSFNRREY